MNGLKWDEDFEYQVHESAVIDPGASIGSNTTIWHFSHVREGAKIGKNCSIGQGCYIGNVIIGDNVRIGNNVSVFDGVIIEDNCFIGPSVVFTNCHRPKPGIKAEIHDKTIIHDGVVIGANATIIAPCEIMKESTIGAGTVITSGIHSGVIFGVPPYQTTRPIDS